MKIGIVGAGKVGGTIATLLESCKFCKSVALADARANIDLTGLKKSKLSAVPPCVLLLNRNCFFFPINSD